MALRYVFLFSILLIAETHGIADFAVATQCEFYRVRANPLGLVASTLQDHAIALRVLRHPEYRITHCGHAVFRRAPVLNESAGQNLEWECGRAAINPYL